MSSVGPTDADCASTGVFNVQPCLRDPVFALIKDRWRLSPLAAALLFFVLGFVGNFLFSLLSGTAFPREGRRLSFLQDRIALVLYPLLVPLGAFLAMRFYRQVEVAFERLYVDGVIPAPREEYNAFLRRLHRLYNSAALHLVALGLALLVYGYLKLDRFFGAPGAWLDFGMGPAPFYELVVGLLAWYSAHLVLLKVVVTAWAIRRLFDWPVKVQPLHPDGCCGLRSLSDIAVTIALFVAVMGMGVILIVLAGTILYHTAPTPEPVLLAVLLETLTPLIFFSCLYRAHCEMKAAKLALLDQVFRALQTRFERLRQELARGEPGDDLAEDVLRLDALQTFIAKLPVWPTNTQMLTQVFLSVAVPLALLLMQVAIEYLIGSGR